MKNVFHADQVRNLSASCGVKEPLAFEPTLDAAIETARKVEADAAIHVQLIAA
jgi:hypothetical protein